LKLEPIKVTAKMMTGQVATTDGYLALDGILAYVWMRENHPELIGTMITDFDEMLLSELPIEKRGTGDDWYYACSFACYTPLKETRRYWHKRFDAQLAEEYVDFENRRGKVNVRSAQYKNYRIPLNILLIPEITWYLVGDKAEIERMVNQITHIGKKASQGLGLVREWTVESIEEDLSWLRPIPDENGDDFISIRPPYWYHGHMRKVRWPDDARLGARNLFITCQTRGISQA
jgi:CRISPR type IV-associated protein Csf3